MVQFSSLIEQTSTWIICCHSLVHLGPTESSPSQPTGRRTSPDCLTIQSLVRRVQNFKARQVVPITQVRQPRHSRCQWRPPPSEFFKINFDGLVFPYDKKSGIGVVIRDCRGLVITSCSKLMHQELGSNDIEVIAAGWALLLHWRWGWRRQC